MKRAGLIVLVLLGLWGWAVWANTGCGCGAETEPTCYETYKSNEIVEFSLVVPVEYFWVQDVSITPLITAWWIETLEGVIVKYVPFGEPKGHWASFAWDLSLESGGYAQPGFYRIVVMTTYGEMVSANIEIVSCCCTPCWGCCPSRCICRPAISCRPTCGELYLKLTSGGTRNCCAFSVTIYGGVEVSSP